MRCFPCGRGFSLDCARPVSCAALLLFAGISIPALAAESDGLILDEAFDTGVKTVQTQTETKPTDNDSFYQRHLANKFALKLSQQIYSQLSRHTTDSGVEKQPTVEDNRLNINIKYQNPFAAGWNLQASAQAKVYWPGDYEYGNETASIDMEGRVENLEARLNELYVTKNFAKHTFKLGRQTIVWGETEGNSILDTLNTTEFRDLSIIEIEDARLNQWFLVWDYFHNDSQRLSTFVNFEPQFNPAFRTNSPAYTQRLTARDAPDDKQRVEFGSRWQLTVEHSDLALMAAYLYENSLSFDYDSLKPFQLQANDNAYWLLGASANRAIGKLLLKLDLAFSHGALAAITVPGGGFFSPPRRPSSVRGEQVGLSAGFEYALSNEQSLSVSVLARSFPWLESTLAPEQKINTDDLFGTWLMRYSHSFSNGDWVFSSTMNGTINGDRTLASGMLSYSFDDHWSLSTQVIGTWAEKSNILANRINSFAILDQDLRLGFTLTYSH